MYILEVKKSLEKMNEELKFKNQNKRREYRFGIKERQEIIEIDTVPLKTEDEDNEFYNDVENIFSKILLDARTLEIVNQDEMMNKWQEIKKKTIFGKKDKMTIKALMELTRFYEDREALTFLVRTHLEIPFIILFYRYKKLGENVIKETIFNIFTNDSVDFIFEFKEEEEKIKLKGELAPNYMKVDYQIILKKLLEIPSSELFYPRIEINGEYEYEEELKSMTVNITINSDRCMKYSKEFKIYIDNNLEEAGIEINNED